MNFLVHLDEWIEQAIDRASSVVAAKVICFFSRTVSRTERLNCSPWSLSVKVLSGFKNSQTEMCFRLYFEF